MASFLSNLAITAAMPVAFKGLGTVAKVGLPAAKWGLGGGIGRRALVGSAIGFAAGGGDYENPNISFGARLQGAALGAIGGAAFAKAPGMLKGVAGMAWRNKGAVLGAGIGVGKIATRAVGFAARHPYLTAGVAAGTYAAAAYKPMSSPTMSGVKVNTDYNRQLLAADDMTAGSGTVAGSPVGPAPVMMGRYHRAMQRSTDGLVQGLHRSRH
jgi:hypothetical protein